MTSDILNISKDKSYLVLKRISLAKQFFEHGFDHSTKPGSLNKMIAIHNMHNAVEIILKAIILGYGIRTDKTLDLLQKSFFHSTEERPEGFLRAFGRFFNLRNGCFNSYARGLLNITFEDMMKDVDKFEAFSMKGKKLPYRAQMTSLNQLRNFVQHDASEPAQSAIEDNRVFTRSFLTEVCKDYFDVDFETVSDIDMVEDELLRKLLKASLGELHNNNLINSLIFIRAAYDNSQQVIYELLPFQPEEQGSANLDVGNFVNELDDLISRKISSKGDFLGRVMAASNFRSLQEFDKKLGQKLYDIEHRSFWNIFALASKLDVREYVWFVETINAVFVEKQNEVIRVYIRNSGLDAENINKAHHFLLDAILLWQSMGLIPVILNQNINMVTQLLENFDNVIVFENL